MGEIFGSLAWDDNLDWWKGSAEFESDHRIDLHIEASNDQISLRRAVERASRRWNWLVAREDIVRAKVAGQLTKAHNEFCASEDEVTEERFARRLRLLSAKFEVSGGLELVYFDGMLLGGHWIVVPIGADDSVGEAFEAG